MPQLLILMCVSDLCIFSNISFQQIESNNEAFKSCVLLKAIPGLSCSENRTPTPNNHLALFMQHERIIFI